MADAVPMISISAEDVGDAAESPSQLNAEEMLTDGDDVSDIEAENEGEDEMRAQSVVQSRQRRKVKKVKKARTNTNVMYVDAGEDEGVTDVETVECDHDDDGADDEAPSFQLDEKELEHVFDAYKPQITQITDDQEGRLHIKNIIRGVVATEISDMSEVSDEEDAPTAKFQSYREVATDVESLDGSTEDEADKSDNQAMNDVIGQFELGGAVHARERHEERTGAAPLPCTSLLPPSRQPNRRKTRKTVKKSSKTPNTIAAPNADDDPVTDIEDLDSVEPVQQQKRKNKSSSSAPSSSSSTALGVPLNDAAALTDIEDLDDIGGAPGIVIDCPATGDDTDEFQSGRTSRIELTDVEMDDSDSSTGCKQPSGGAAFGLALPEDNSDPLTDVEDIDDVEEMPVVVVVRSRPRLCTAQSQVIELEEDENGVETVISHKKGLEAELLLCPQIVEEGGVTDVEDMAASEDDHEDIHDAQPSPIPHDISGHLESSSVQVTDMDGSQQDPTNEAAAAPAADAAADAAADQSAEKTATE